MCIKGWGHITHEEIFFMKCYISPICKGSHQGKFLGLYCDHLLESSSDLSGQVVWILFAVVRDCPVVQLVATQLPQWSQ